MSGLALAGGFAADLLVGDPRRGHPVAGFGRVALALERRVYAPSRLRGAIFSLVLVGGAALVAELAARTASRIWGGRAAVLVLVTWAALGGRSLARAGDGIAERLERGDLDGARAKLPSLCGRDAAALDETEICRAAVESVAENTSDAVVGALLWGAVAGPAGVAAYRAANTLDAMVGHRSERYAQFGWASARLDDLMGWPGARAGAALTALCAPIVGGSPRAAWRALRRDGAAHPSPNAGRMEAAFAGALGVRLGGPLAYGGRAEVRPTLGDGRAPGASDLRRAARLSLAVGAAAVLACAALARGPRIGPGRSGSNSRSSSGGHS
ncbi:MAG TPA: cobalamin biosynthesis protein [Conexibacter sp.]|nr:cobalamin biosynthesis protein [Conexibacter sp.]